MLKGKKGVVLGVANKRSLAWGIAQACVRHGAEIALTYQGERFRAAAEALVPKLGAPEGTRTPLFACDVTDIGQIELANFVNPTGLLSLGGNAFQPSFYKALFSRRR